MSENIVISPGSIIISPNRKWIILPSVPGWLRIDTIMRLTINSHAGTSIVYVNVFYVAGENSDYFPIRVANIQEGERLIRMIMEVVGT